MNSEKTFMEKIKKLAKTRLITIVCLDEPGIFRLLYKFDLNGKIKEIVLTIKKSKPIVESISELFPLAGIFEREIHDFFGVEFSGNPRLHDKLFLPEHWKGKPPLLKGGEQ